MTTITRSPIVSHTVVCDCGDVVVVPLAEATAECSACGTVVEVKGEE